MSFTSVDTENAHKFARTNERIRLLRLMHERAPHLVSHLKVTLRPATEKDYRIPPGLEHACQVLQIESTEELCKQLSCNPTKETSVCGPDERASYYHLGDSAHDVQCQPACYNTVRQEQRKDSGERSVDTPMLNFARGECRKMPESIVAFLEKPFYRSSVKFESLLNNLPTGFTRKTHPYGSGVTYVNDAAYCGYYERNFNAKTGTCDLGPLDYFLDAILGSALVNVAKASVRCMFAGGNFISMPSHVPPLPQKLEERYTLEGWRKHINSEFRVPDLVDTRPKLSVRRTDLGAAARQIVIPEFDERDISDFIRRRAGLDSATMDNAQYTQVNPSSSSGGSLPHEPKPITKTTTQEHIDAIINGLYESFATVEGLKSQAIGLGTDLAVSQIRKQSLKIVQKLTRRLATKLGGVGVKMSARVIAHSLRIVCAKTIANFVVKLGIRAGILAAKLTAAASTVVGLVLALAFVLDFIFQLWDPFGYNNLFPATYAADLMANGELQLRHSLGSADTTYGFEDLADLLLTKADRFNIHLESLEDVTIYLDSLVVNSEGSRIDKGEEIEFTQHLMSGPRIDALQQAAAAKQFRFDPDTFAAYNERFNRRVELVSSVNRAASMCAGLAVLVALTNLSNMICALLLLTAAVLAAVARYSLHESKVLDVYNEHYYSVFHSTP